MDWTHVIGLGMFKVSPVFCEEVKKVEGNALETTKNIFFNYLNKPKPLTEDEKFRAGIVPITTHSGGRPHQETLDQRNHQAYAYPWPSDRTPFHPVSSHIDDPSTENHAHALPANGFKTPPVFESEWEKHLAYHHGLYHPEAFQPPKAPDCIQKEVAEFAENVFRDDPQDACKYLLIEEQKCLNQEQFKMVPHQAAQQCIKWFVEWNQCKWDQEKFTRGYNYIESRQERKHRPFYTTPDFRFA